MEILNGGKHFQNQSRSKSVRSLLGSIVLFADLLHCMLSLNIWFTYVAGVGSSYIDLQLTDHSMCLHMTAAMFLPAYLTIIYGHPSLPWQERFALQLTNNQADLSLLLCSHKPH